MVVFNFSESAYSWRNKGRKQRGPRTIVVQDLSRSEVASLSSQSIWGSQTVVKSQLSGGNQIFSFAMTTHIFLADRTNAENTKPKNHLSLGS